jgi:NCS1 family nucleobase:cation symporter-1
MAVIGIATQYVSNLIYKSCMPYKLTNIRPWQLLATADKFLAVLSGFGVFMAPAT